MQLFFFQEGTGHIGRNRRKQPINNNGYTLLALIACHFSDDAFEFSFRDAYCLTRIELGNVACNHQDVFFLLCTYLFQTVHLIRGYNYGLTYENRVLVRMLVVEAEGFGLLISIVIDVCLEVAECIVCKKEIGKPGLFYLPVMAIHELVPDKRRTIYLYILGLQVFAGFFFAPVGAAYYIPKLGLCFLCR